LPVREHRSRYILFRWRVDILLDRRILSHARSSSIMRLYGEVGASRTSLKIVDMSADDNLAIVRCSHTAVDMVRAAASAIRELDGRPIVIYSLGTSGTIKSLRDKFGVKKHP
jgi:RNase P/RNase MRP subunit POP5